MKFSFMTCAAISIALLAQACRAAEVTVEPATEIAPQGWLMRVTRSPAGGVRVQRVAYQFREGDLIFFQSGSFAWQSLFSFHGSTGPTHVGIVVRNADGEVGLLQAVDPSFGKPVSQQPGVVSGRVCWTPNLVEYLNSYDGHVFIRPYRGEFPAASASRLQTWAQRQVGKPYGLAKVLVPPTGLPIQIFHLGGKAQVEANSWFCSELVASALVVTGHLDPWKVRPVRTDPEDLFSDRWIHLDGYWESPQFWKGDTTPRNTPAVSQPQTTPGSSLVRLTIHNNTAERFQIEINGTKLGELLPHQPLTAKGPVGAVEITATSLAPDRAVYRLKMSMTGDTSLTFP